MIINTLPDKTWHSRQQLTALLHELQAANPDAKWSKSTERMGIDQDDNVNQDGMPWYKAETYKLGGSPIFEIVRKADHEEWNDVRASCLGCASGGSAEHGVQ